MAQLVKSPAVEPDDLSLIPHGGKQESTPTSCPLHSHSDKHNPRHMSTRVGEGREHISKSVVKNTRCLWWFECNWPHKLVGRGATQKCGFV